MLICTWNIDAARPDALEEGTKNGDFLRDLLHDKLGDDGGEPDLIVFGFQEVVDLENRSVAASELLFPFIEAPVNV